jgi:gamma-glutamyltranspeptidase/glutathione hydrolase
VYALNAAYRTFKNEIDPATIPRPGIPSGRTALVPGFFAGIESAHRRFGCLPWARIFTPAIAIAANGFVIDGQFAKQIKMREAVLRRLDATRALFTKYNGHIYGEGDIFKQPILADTLNRIATRGAAYVYQEEWARKFVNSVREEGGKVTLDDLVSYRAEWTEPTSAKHYGYKVHSAGLPNYGGLDLIEAMNLVERSDILKHGHYTRSAKVLYWLIQICRTRYFISQLADNVPRLDVSQRSRLTKHTAHRLWPIIKSGALNNIAPDMIQTHSDGVVAADRAGNVAVLCHSGNTILWGTTGIFIDGVSIPDAASLQQSLIASVQPGAAVPNSTNPGIVTKEGGPILAFSSVGGGSHELTVQTLVSILDYGFQAQDVGNFPVFMGPPVVIGDVGEDKFDYQTVAKGEFPSDLLADVRALGQRIWELDRSADRDQLNLQMGYLIDIEIEGCNTFTGVSSAQLPNSVVARF